MAYLVARPLAARRVHPDALTALGLALAVAVVPLAGAGGRWPVLAALVAALSGLVDSLDGAVAVLASRTSRWGSMLDSLIDRLSDAAYCVALWALGAPVWLAVLAGGLALLQEYLRARAGGAGMADVGVVTVSERPTRVVGVAAFCLAAGVYPESAALWGTVGAAAGVAAGSVGLGQLLIVVRRRLR